MEIRFSNYNSPFVESSSLDVHYISKDDQCLMRLGLFDAHCQLYRSIPVPRTIEFFDALSGTNHVHELTGIGFFRPFNSSPTVVGVHVDFEVTDQLRKSKIKVASSLASRCTCGNHRRPWRCKCK